MDKVKEALRRFKSVVESLECWCEESNDCTIHKDLILADEAIKQYDNKLTPGKLKDKYGITPEEANMI